MPFSLNTQNQGEPIAVVDNSFIYLQNIVDKEGDTEAGGKNVSVFPYFKDTPEQVHRIMVSGASGSGKSHTIGLCLDQMSETFPNHKVVIFSWVEKDKALDKERNGKMPLRVDMHSEHLMELQPIDLKDTIVIMDDIEKGTKKDIVKFLLNLRAQLCETARHYNTHLFNVSHSILGGSLNDTVKNESTGLFLFPAYNNFYKMKGFLERYMGFSPEICKEIKEIPSRWVYLNLQAPNYYIYDKGVKLIT